MNQINSKIFKEYDIRGRYPLEIDQDAAYRLGAAFILSQKAKKIVVSRDLRPESKKVLAAFMAGAAYAGAKIYDLRVSSTPEMFFAVSQRNFDCGAIATASHNPKGFAGFKLATSQGLSLGLKTGLKAVAQKASEIKSPPVKKMPKAKRLDIANEYAKFVLSLVNAKSIKNFNLVFDASSGTAARIISKVFARLPIKTAKINFGGADQARQHGFNPMLSQNQLPAKQEIKKQRADFGVIWDGDGDRCIFLDRGGKFIHPYYINCLLSQIILIKKPKIKIIIDARMPVGPAEIIKQFGGQPVVNRSGYANIVKAMKEQKIIFGCENSGHYFVNLLIKNNRKNFVISDAIIPVLLVLEYLSQNHLSLAEAVRPWQKKYFISGEINLPQIDFKKIRAKLKRHYQHYQQKEVDGLSIFGQEWFLNVRPSKTEPLVRINIEAKNRKNLQKIKKDLLKLIN